MTLKHLIPSDQFPSVTRPEIWGGIECTVARIGDLYRNQIVETGHVDRDDDLAAIAALGIRTLRYPVVWETIAPDRPDQSNWQWHDRRLAQLQALDVKPIAGLIHHGSGPRYTNLLDPAFPELLAAHAERVAARYPWIESFTPVNEPLTTARFSGLYGHWYPHGRDTPTFLRALIIQCRAVVLSMRAIRRITPSAQLVQTEDLGKIFSTPLLRYQADYENQRRWLSFDLLCGKIDRTHPWYRVFLQNGIGARDLDFFLDAQCVPDIIGINHYLTSERFLDERMQGYPDGHKCGNGRHRYADVEAVRVEETAGQTGPEARLREAWERYGLPIAVTEAHHGCSRDEQLRWLIEVWNAALAIRAEGADIRAVTIWSMLGAVDWNSLLMQRHGFYESGVFDTRCKLRPTALAAATASLVSTGKFDHPVLDDGGWWRRGDRFYHGASQDVATHARAPRKIAITGANGTLGRAFARICKQRGLAFELLSRDDMDIADTASVEAALKVHGPWALVNAAGYVRVADAEHDAARCFRENAHGAEVLARACAKFDIPYLTFSSDLVFDGMLGRAYVESDAVCPTSIYGNSKVEAERRVADTCPDALIVRTSAFFGPWDRFNFVHAALHGLGAGRCIEASDQLLVSPTYVPDLVHAALDLLIDKASGVWHLANQGVISWHELASRAAQKAGIDTGALIRTSDGQSSMTALSSERGLILPSVDDALQRYVRETTFAW
ncbi:MAG: sugar nucleotide-binding protein [Herminiimonas sp.]|nr:sugar nucleotide-binding protein [Herminiimonas sp.]